MYKKGIIGDQFVFNVVVVLFLMAVISIGLVVGLTGFFGKGYDFREAEVELLYDKTIECLNENVIFSDDFTLSDCGFNENVEDKRLIYVKEGDQEIFFGVRDYINQCELNLVREKPICIRDVVEINGRIFEIVVGTNHAPVRKVFE